MLPKVMSLVTIVALLAWMIFFMQGSLGLLLLRHRDPADSRTVRGFFDVHYLVLMVVASAGTLSSAIAGRLILAATIACITIVGFTARRVIISRMDQLRSTMSPADRLSIRKFRRLHLTGIALNLVLLAGFFSALKFSSADLVACVDPPLGCVGGNCRVQCSLL